MKVNIHILLSCRVLRIYNRVEHAVHSGTFDFSLKNHVQSIHRYMLASMWCTHRSFSAYSRDQRGELGRILVSLFFLFFFIIFDSSLSLVKYQYQWIWFRGNTLVRLSKCLQTFYADSGLQSEKNMRMKHNTANAWKSCFCLSINFSEMTRYLLLVVWSCCSMFFPLSLSLVEISYKTAYSSRDMRERAA